MSFLLDTDILSDDTKPRPSGLVNAWIEANETRIYTSAITIGELRRGIERLSLGARRTRLEQWLEGLLVRMDGHILAYNTRAAETWGEMMADLERKGHKLPLTDSFIAAIAKRHNLTLVTRNTADFKHSGVKVLNPFE